MRAASTEGWLESKTTGVPSRISGQETEVQRNEAGSKIPVPGCARATVVKFRVTRSR